MVSGPKIDSPDSADGVGGLTSQQVDREAATDGATFEALVQAQADSVEVERPVASAQLQQVTDQLRAGEITGAQAADQLVEAVSRSLAQLAPELEQRIRDELRRQIAQDPLLADQIRRLRSGND